MKNTPEAFRVIKLKVLGFQRIEAAEIEFPDQTEISIGGKNGHGKSSTMDALMVGLAGAKYAGDRPIHEGADGLDIEINLKGQVTGQEYIVRRTKSEKAGWKLEVTTPNGRKFDSPQSFLDTLLGDAGVLMLNSSTVISGDSAKQFAIFKKLLNIDFTELEEQIKTTFDERTLVNRDVATLSAQWATQPLPDAPEGGELVAEEVQAKLNEANEANQVVVDAQAKATNMLRDVQFAKEEVTRAEARKATADKHVAELEEALEAARKAAADSVQPIEDAKQKVLSVSEQQATAQKFADGLQKVDVQELIDQLGNIEKVNQVIRQRNAILEGIAKLTQAQERSKALTAKLEELQGQKSATLAAAKFPVELMSFGDEEVLYKGQPLSCASDAERVLIGTAVAFEMAGQVKMAAIRNASLFDADTHAMVRELAEKHGCQYLFEIVGSDDNTTIVIEDGKVARFTPKAEVAAR